MASNGSLNRKVPLTEVAQVHGWSRAVYWGSIVVAVIFGGTWIIAGAIKARDPFLFLLDIRSFQILHDPWAAYVALGLPWLEIFCGICVIVRRMYLGALTIISGMLVVFLVAIFSAKQRGLDITCGCFGKTDNKTDYGEIITRDIVMLVCALALMGASWWLGQVAKKASSKSGAG